MRAIEAAAPGGPEVLQYVEVPDPVPGPGQVLVRTEAVGVNFYDTYVRSGVYAARFPLRPGSEGAGIVTALGPDVTALAVGDRVAFAATASGAYAEQVLVREREALPVPTALDAATAAALPLQGMTAHMLIDGVHRVHSGETVFITAGAGGVGQLFIQLAKARGARVLTMVGTPDKAATARSAGADLVLVQSELPDLVPDLTAALRAATDGEGVDVAYDGLGRDTFDASVASTRRRGLVVLFGGASGQVPPFDLQRLNAAGSLFVTRPTLGHYTADDAERARRWAEVAGPAAEGALRVQIGARFPLEQAAGAHAALAARATSGKVLLIP